MKKLVLLVAMFLCGTSIFALAQDPVKKNQPVTEQNENKTDSTVSVEPAQEDTVKQEPKSEEPAKDAPATGETPAQSAE